MGSIFYLILRSAVTADSAILYHTSTPAKMIADSSTNRSPIRFRLSKQASLLNQANARADMQSPGMRLNG
jgi:hypothetical protein